MAFHRHAKKNVLCILSMDLTESESIDVFLSSPTKKNNVR